MLFPNMSACIRVLMKICRFYGKNKNKEQKKVNFSGSKVFS